jgi:hypothetical protein
MNNIALITETTHASQDNCLGVLEQGGCYHLSFDVAKPLYLDLKIVDDSSNNTIEILNKHHDLLPGTYHYTFVCSYDAVLKYYLRGKEPKLTNILLVKHEEA